MTANFPAELVARVLVESSKMYVGLRESAGPTPTIHEGDYEDDNNATQRQTQPVQTLARVWSFVVEVLM